jgi:hypothetical protein
MDVWTNGGRFFAGMHTNNWQTHQHNTVGVDADNGLIFLTRAQQPNCWHKGYDVYVLFSPNQIKLNGKF